MEWLLLAGLSLIGIGALYWIRAQRPLSPLLEEASLQQLYKAIEAVFQKVPEENPAYTHTPNGLLLSYLYQHEQHQIDEASTPIHLHNFSLTIPKNKGDSLVWDEITQRQITHFVLNTLQQDSVHAVMRSKHGILMINLLFTTDEQHTSLQETVFDCPNDCSSLLQTKCTFELKPVPEEMELLISSSEESMSSTSTNESSIQSSNEASSSGLV